MRGVRTPLRLSCYTVVENALKTRRDVRVVEGARLESVAVVTAFQAALPPRAFPTSASTAAALCSGGLDVAPWIHAESGERIPSAAERDATFTSSFVAGPTGSVHASDRNVVNANAAVSNSDSAVNFALCRLVLSLALCQRRFHRVQPHGLGAPRRLFLSRTLRDTQRYRERPPLC